MNKKILDAALTVMFCVCLIASANIQEWNADEGDIAGKSDTEICTGAEENDTVAAGVSRVLSRYSFTTESDEKTGIEKKQKTWVTAPEGNDGTLIGKYRDGIANDVKEEAVKTASTVEADVLLQPEYHNRWNISLTKEEIDLLARIVWLESCGEPQEGQEAVVEVVFNRIASEQYPNTVYDVLSQKNPVQFCSWKNRDIAKPTEKEYQSIYQVLNGNTNILRNDTLYFSTEPLTPRIDVTIGGHSFCY